MIVAGLVNGSIKVFNPSSGNLMTVLDNEEVAQDAMPISRVRCKPFLDGHPNNYLAATYVSGYLRIWNYSSGHCIGQVRMFFTLEISSRYLLGLFRFIL